MKKNLIGAIVGGIIIFIWEFISFGAVNLHEKAQGYTEKQDAIITFLQQQNLPEGGYAIPSLPKNATKEQWDKMGEELKGKPWAMVQYHQSYNDNMVVNMVRCLLINIVMVYLFCWLIGRFRHTGGSTIVLAALATGMIVFFNAPYTGFIWYKSFDIWASFADAVVAWGLTGLWLSWWMNRNRQPVQKFQLSESALQSADA